MAGSDRLYVLPGMFGPRDKHDLMHSKGSNRASDALAVQCPALTRCGVVPGHTIVFRLDTRVFSKLEGSNPDMLLRVRHAVSGTDMVYAASRRLVRRGSSLP